ncbi:MAG: DNA polymerase/3'-5' exonuclease PolX [bacterium]
MIREEIIKVFEGIADILQIKGEDMGKAKMYRSLAITLSYELPEDVDEQFVIEKLAKIRGIGPATLEKVIEIVNTGKCQYYEGLKASIPPGVLDLISISGVGPSTAARLYHELNIDSLEALKLAIEDQKLRNLKGMGKKTEEKIKSGLEALMRYKQLRLMGYVLPDVVNVVGSLRKLNKSCSEVQIVGDLRRKTETINKVQILASCNESVNIKEALKDIDQIIDISDDWSSSFGTAKLKGNVDLQFHFVEPESFGVSLIHYTGSDAFLTDLNAYLEKFGMSPIFPDNLPDWAKSKSEEDIFKIIGLPFIVPELREGSGELEAAIEGKLPKLIELSDIRGDLHVHSNWSDGHETIAKMAESAKQLGYEYIAFCDHSVSSKIANGLDIERILNKMIELREVNEKINGIEILMGAEVDILKDGRLDYPDEILEKLDLVIASIHSGFGLDESDMTKRVISAIENRFVHIVGHPTGRLLAKREPYKINIDEVISASAENNKSLELNAYPDRLDLKDIDCKKAKEHNVKIAINTDAHSISDLGFMKFGIYTARRGWLEKKDVINTLSLSDLMKFLSHH